MQVDPLARRKIQALVEQALAETGVAGTFPTPLDPLREYVGIRELIDMSQLPEEFVAKKPPAWKRILGAVIYREETSFVDLSQTAERVLFTDAHETSHVARGHPPARQRGQSLPRHEEGGRSRG